MSETLGLGLQEPADRNGAFPRLTVERQPGLRAVGEGSMAIRLVHQRLGAR
jgi:hypothetical protein